MKSKERKERDWKWWLSTLGQGLLTAGVAFLPDYAPELIKQITPEHTLLYKTAIPIGLVLKYVRTQYQASKTPEKVPESVLKKLPKKKLPKGMRK